MSVEVIYIVGAGRSGSTVLGTVLGDHPDVVNLGELVNLVEAAWVNDEYCACGRQGSECPFWRNVRASWSRRMNGEDITAYHDIQRIGEHYRNFPKLWFAARTVSERFRRYRRWTQALYAAILEVSGKSVIVDSSKNPVRAFALAQLPEIDLCVVHLVRDGRGFAWSVQKSHEKDVRGGVQHDIPPMPLWRAVASWSLANVGAVWARRQVPDRRAARVHYEDFVEAPAKVLKEIGRLADLDYTRTARRLAEGEPIRVGHVIAGNRVRMSKKIKLRPDMEWRRGMPLSDQSRFYWLTAPLMKYLGYSRSV